MKIVLNGRKQEDLVVDGTDAPMSAGAVEEGAIPSVPMAIQKASSASVGANGSGGNRPPSGNKGGTLPPARQGLRFGTYERASVSTERTGSHTFEAQEHEIATFLDREYGANAYSLRRFYDDGVSGALGHVKDSRNSRIRPGLAQLRDAVSNGELDGIIVFNLSRLARDTFLLLDLVRNEIMPRRMIFRSVTEPFDIYTPEGMLLLTVLSSANTFQRDDVARRVRLANDNSLRGGFFIGCPGYGWRLESKDEVNIHSLPQMEAPSPAEAHSQSSETADAEAADGDGGDGDGNGADGDGTDGDSTKQLMSKDRAEDPVVAEVARPGYGRVRPRLMRVELEGKIVVELKELYLAGSSLGKIADELNQRGVPSPGGKRWFINGVARVLFNPVHCGYVKRKAELYPGEHSARAYYTVADYEQLLERRKERNAGFMTNTANTCAKHLLNGIAFCGHCESRLYISLGDKEKPALRCLTGRNVGRRTCPHMSVKLNAVQQAAISQIEQLCLQPEMYAILEEAAEKALQDEDVKLSERKEEIEYNLRRLQTRIDRLFDNLTTGCIPAEQFKAQNDRLLADQQAAQWEQDRVQKQIENRRQRQKKADAVRQSILDFPQMWERRSPEEKHEILSLLIEHLYVYKNGSQASIRIKLYLLPEQTLDIAFCFPAKLKPAQRTGVESLTPRSMALIYHYLKGKTLPEIQEVMRIAEPTCKYYMTEARKRMEVESFEEAAALARAHVMANVSNLPLGPNANYERADGELFSTSQKAVWELMRRGATNKQITAQLGMTDSAVSNSRHRILQALDAPDLFTAITKADQLGINS